MKDKREGDFQPVKVVSKFTLNSEVVSYLAFAKPFSLSLKNLPLRWRSGEVRLCVVFFGPMRVGILHGHSLKVRRRKESNGTHLFLLLFKEIFFQTSFLPLQLQCRAL